MTDQDRVNFTVAGKAWHNAMDPNATQMPDERGWPAHTRIRRVGRGLQFVYEDVPREVAEDIAWWLWEIGDGWLTGTDPETAADGRSLVRAAESIRQQIADEGVSR